MISKNISQLSTLYASMASHSELLTRRTYCIQCIGPSGDLVRCSGTLNYPPTISTWTQTLPQNTSHNFILKRLLQYMEFLQCNGEELTNLARWRSDNDLSNTCLLIHHRHAEALSKQGCVVFLEEKWNTKAVDE